MPFTPYSEMLSSLILVLLSILLLPIFFEKGENIKSGGTSATLLMGVIGPFKDLNRVSVQVVSPISVCQEIYALKLLV